MAWRRAQGAVELPLAAVLVAGLLCATWAVGVHVWRDADAAIAAERHHRVAQQGGR